MEAKTETLQKSPSCLFYALLILLFYPPFFRGLFFQKEMIPTQIFIAIVFLIYFLFNRKEEIEKQHSVVEWGMLLIVICYVISTLFSVNINLSIQETLKYISYLCILILAKRHIDDPKKIKTTINVLIGAGLVVVFIGIGAALETFQYNGAFTGGMVNSTFQYHNTFGTYCLAILFLTYSRLGDSIGKEKYFMSFASFVMFFGLILSQSRGAWVLIPVVGLIYYLLVSKEHKISLISNTIGNLTATMIILNKFMTATTAQSKEIGWIWLIIGIVVSILIALLIEKILYKMNIKEKTYNLFIPCLAIIAPAGLFMIKDRLLVFLPQDIAQRIATISLGTNTVTERTVFYKDALKMIKDYPLFGTGGGGWDTLNQMYQSYAYNSTQAHNYYMQVWVEIGTIGITILGLMLVAYLFYSYKTYMQCKNISTRNTLVGIFVSVITILLHSTIDFDLTLSAMAIILWALIGMQLSMYKGNEKIKLNISYVMLCLSVVLLFISTTNYFAMQANTKAINYAQTGDIQRMELQFKKASKLNPFDPVCLGQYANVANSIAVQRKNESEFKQSIVLMDQAVSLGKYDFKILLSAAKFYIKNGEIDKGLDAIKRLEETHPLNSSAYENKAMAFMTVANIYIKQNDNEKAIPLLKEIVEIEKKVATLNEDIKNSVEMNDMVRFVEIREKTRKNIDEAKKVLSETESNS